MILSCLLHITIPNRFNYKFVEGKSLSMAEFYYYIKSDLEESIVNSSLYDWKYGNIQLYSFKYYDINGLFYLCYDSFIFRALY